MGHCVRLVYPSATSGTFEVRPHGETSVDAAIYSDYDCLTPRTSRTLNASGLASFYVKELVDVTVYTSAGAVVDGPFTEGVRGEAVQVASASFTGTDPETGSQVAGGVLSAKARDDLWIESAGARDYKVRRTGATSDETLVQAFAAVAADYSPFFNVKAYGAVGDGSTDDYPAFLAAYNAAVAAGGGIIYVPGSSNPYILAQVLSITSPLVSVLGAGAEASLLKSTVAVVNSPVISVNLSATTEVKSWIRGVGLFNANTDTIALKVASAPGFGIYEVEAAWTDTVGSNGLFDLDTRVVMRDCRLSIDDNTAAEFIEFAAGAADTLIDGCVFDGDSNGTNQSFYIHVLATDVVINNCTFSRNEVGTPSRLGSIYVPSSAGARCKITNCHFQQPAAGLTGTGAAGIELAAATTLFESGNTINRTQDSTHSVFYLTGGGAAAIDVHRGSRIGRTISSSPGATYTPELAYETHIVSVSANLAVASPGFSREGSCGGRTVFIIHNSSGGAINVTWDGVFNVTASPTAVAAGQRCRIEFVCDPSSTVYRALAAASVFT